MTHMLEDYSRARNPTGRLQRIGLLRSAWKVSNPVGLSQEESGLSRDIVLSNIKGTLLELEDIRGMGKESSNYWGGITASAYFIMNRKFAPTNDRLRSLVAREKLMPAVLQDARANLKDPPHISTEIALEQLPGDISFFRRDLPSAFADATDPQVKTDLQSLTPLSLQLWKATKSGCGRSNYLSRTEISRLAQTFIQKSSFTMK